MTSFLVTNVHNSSVSWFSHIDELAEKAAATERYKVGHLLRQAAKLKAEQEEAARKGLAGGGSANSTDVGSSNSTDTGSSNGTDAGSGSDSQASNSTAT